MFHGSVSNSHHRYDLHCFCKNIIKKTNDKSWSALIFTHLYIFRYSQKHINTNLIHTFAILVWPSISTNTTTQTDQIQMFICIQVHYYYLLSIWFPITFHIFYTTDVVKVTLYQAEKLLMSPTSLQCQGGPYYCPYINTQHMHACLQKLGPSSKWLTSVSDVQTHQSPAFNAAAGFSVIARSYRLHTRCHFFRPEINNMSIQMLSIDRNTHGR